MKRLIPLFLICFLFSFSTSAFQSNENNPCCEITIVADTAPSKCLTEADLVGFSWVEQIDTDIASTKRIFNFNRFGHLDISTIFSDGFVESDVASWSLDHKNGKTYLSIDDPVLGETITYELKGSSKNLRLKEIGFDEHIVFKKSETIANGNL